MLKYRERGAAQRHIIQLQHLTCQRQRATVKQTGNTAEPSLWGGHPEVQSTVWSIFETPFSSYLWFIRHHKKGTCSSLWSLDWLTPSPNILHKHHPCQAHHHVSDPQHRSRKKHYGCKRWHPGRLHYATFDLPGFPNRLFLSSGPNKMHCLAGICCSAAIQILAPLASFGGPALWFRK